MKPVGVLLLLALTACNPLVRQDDLDAIKADARYEKDRMNIALGRISTLERQVEAQRKYIDAISDGTTAALNTGLSLSKQVADNAKVANENAVAEMNRRGACGSRPRYNYNERGEVTSIVNEKILCTIADLVK